MSELEPMDTELARLFEEERAAHVPEPIARREVFARVEKSLLLATLAVGAVKGAAGAGAGASAVTAGLVSNAAKIKVALLVAVAAAGTFAAGVVVGRTSKSTPSASSTPSSSTLVTAVAPASATAPLLVPSSSSSSAAPGISAAPSSDVLPTPASAAPPVSASAVSAATDDLPKEQALLDTARAALARGRPDDALAAIASHASTFPRGRLVEDRDALAVQAHAAAGHTDEAKARAQRFRARYPKSIYLPAIDRAIAGR